MKKLYIIGNGFDLYHNLPTSYDNFHNHIIQHCTDLKNIFEEYFELRTEGNKPWTHFEEDLGTFNWNSFFDNNNNLEVQDDNFRSSYVFSLEDDLKEQGEQLHSDINEAFQDWLETIDILTATKKFDFDQTSKIINFNYTLLLEELYEIESNRILHIHGDIVNTPGDLIFGHNLKIAQTPELDENGDSNRTIFTDSENASKYPFIKFYKPVEEIIAKNSKAFESLTKIENIIVVGHSLNQIDIPYFKKISFQSPNAKWNVSYYLDNEKEKHLETLLQIGISYSNIQLFKL